MSCFCLSFWTTGISPSSNHETKEPRLHHQQFEARFLALLRNEWIEALYLKKERSQQLHALRSFIETIRGLLKVSCALYNLPTVSVSKVARRSLPFHSTEHPARSPTSAKAERTHISHQHDIQKVEEQSHGKIRQTEACRTRRGADLFRGHWNPRNQKEYRK